MLSAIKLLKLAEDLAGRIPLDPPYQDERNVSWAVIGEGWLRVGAIEGAQRALDRLSAPKQQAQLRLEICRWFADNAEAGEGGRAVLRDTVEHLAHWEEFFSRVDIADLLAVTHREFGENTIHEMAGRLSDSFTKSNVLVMLAFHQQPAAQLETLREAERLSAGCVRDGDRDFALRWVLDGYRAAGYAEDAERVRSQMGLLPEQMDEPLHEAEEILAKVDQLLQGEEPEELPLDQARRLVEYRFNDLKIRFLVNQAQSGGFVNHDLEDLVLSERFLQVEPARQPGIHSAPPLCDDEQFARFFFERPIPATNADKQLLEGDYHSVEIKDPAKFVERVTSLFRHFGEIGPRYSLPQVDQGFWYLFGHPFSFGEYLFNSKAPLEAQRECIRAMLCPFRDYNAHVSHELQGTIFYMWWDILLHGCGDWEAHEDERGEQRTEIERVATETLQQILALPSKDCREAALHGLNHLHPNPQAWAVVSRYLDENRDRMTDEEIEFAKACRDGHAG